jgi:hypothetical protein
MASETTTEQQKMETLVFNDTVREAFTQDEIALSSMVREMIADCGGDDQPIELFMTGKFNDISTRDLVDFIELWKYAATAEAKPILEKIAVRSIDAQTATNSTIHKLADSKSVNSLCKMIIVANFLAIEPLINIYASRLAKAVTRDPEAFKRAVSSSSD